MVLGMWYPVLKFIVYLFNSFGKNDVNGVLAILKFT